MNASILHNLVVSFHTDPAVSFAGVQLKMQIAREFERTVAAPTTIRNFRVKWESRKNNKRR